MGHHPLFEIFRVDGDRFVVRDKVSPIHPNIRNHVHMATQDEHLCGVRFGQERQIVELIENQVGLLSSLDSSSTVLFSHSARPPNSGKVDGFCGGEPLSVVGVGHIMENGTDFDCLQQVLGVVARGAITSKGNRDASISVSEDRGDPTAKSKVAKGIVDQSAAILLGKLKILVDEMDGVGEGGFVVQETEFLQLFKRSAPKLGAEKLLLVVSLQAVGVSSQPVFFAESNEAFVQIVRGKLQAGGTNRDVEPLLGSVVFLGNLGHEIEDVLCSLHRVLSLVFSGTRANAVGKIFHVENERRDVSTNPQHLVCSECGIETLNFFPGEETEVVNYCCASGHDGLETTVERRKKDVLNFSHNHHRAIDQTGKPNFEGGVVNHSTAPKFAAVGVCICEAWKKESVLARDFLECDVSEFRREAFSFLDDRGNVLPDNRNGNGAVSGGGCVKDETTFNQEIFWVCHFLLQ